MEFILGGRHTGKTTELIKKSAETQTYILVTNRKRQDMLWKQAREMGITDMPYPITLDDIKRTGNCRGSFIRKILADDLDDIVKELFSPLDIDAVTISSDGINTINMLEKSKEEKLQKIEQIINEYNNGDDMEYVYLGKIREVLEDE